MNIRRLIVNIFGDTLTTMSKVLECPHRASISSLTSYCLQGKFPMDCENCDCKDKKWVEVWSDVNTREI